MDLQTAANGIGLSAVAVKYMLSYISCEIGTGWKNNYISYLYGCVSINFIRKECDSSGTNFRDTMYRWGSYYRTNVPRYAESPTDAAKKGLYFAIQQLDSRAIYADGPGYVPSNYFYSFKNYSGDMIYIRSTY